MTKAPYTQKARGELWATMSLVERAIRKCERTIDAQIKWDGEQNRHGGVLRLIEARRLLAPIRKLAADHEDMV